MTYERQVQINSIVDGGIILRGAATTVQYTKNSGSLILDAADFSGAGLITIVDRHAADGKRMASDYVIHHTADKKA